MSAQRGTSATLAMGLAGLVVGLAVGLVAGGDRGEPAGTTESAASLAARAPGDDSPVVIRVGSEEMTSAELDLRWTEVLGRRERDDLRRRGGLTVYADEVAEELLLAREARRRGVHERPEVRAALRSATNHVVTRSLLQDEVREKAVAETELRALYERRRDEWVEPTRVRVREILVALPEGADASDEGAWGSTRAEAETLRQRVLAGEDFAALAREHSAAPTARYGGEVGWVVRGRFLASYEEAALGLRVGDVSEPVRSEDGWVLLQAEERREEQGASFEEKREELLDALLADDPGAGARRYRIFIDSLKRAEPVTVDDELLDAARRDD